MKNILITTLLLGCLIAFTSAYRGLFEFHDSYGRCWRCSPGSACVRCSTKFVPFVSGPPDEWDRACPKPTPETCAEWPGVKFPHVDIGFFWICADEGVIVEAPCFCDQVFDMRQQECVKTDQLTSIGCITYANPDPHPCGEGDHPPPVTFPPDVTTPTTITTTLPEGVTTPSVPTAPNDPADTTTTTTPTGSTISVPTVTNEGPTTTEYTTTTTTTTSGPSEGTTTSPRTTEVGGPGASPHPSDSTTSVTVSVSTTTDDDSTTTPPPCVCIVWWPCWCNPCWNMPCHSCNGCVGMMG